MTAWEVPLTTYMATSHVAVPAFRLEECLGDFIISLNDESGKETTMEVSTKEIKALRDELTRFLEARE